MSDKASDPGAAQASAVSGRWWILFVLTLVYSLNVVDRYLLGILLPQIKAELALPDWSLGVLSGFAFAIFYATLGLPIARLADKHSRKTIISACLGLFSVATALCGFATSFFTLFLARIGVGVGEAGTGPASYSIISDLFEKARRSTAMAIYAIGGNIGLLVGFAVGGYMAANYGWRTAFFVIGTPGVLVALLAYLTVRDPQRGAADGLAGEECASTSMMEAFRFLWSQPAFRWIVIGSTLVQFLGTGVVNWLPSMLERSHSMVEDEVGIKLGLAIGVAGSIGTLILGGLVADRLSKRDLRWGLWVLVIGELLLIPGYALVLIAPTGDLAITAFVLPAMLATFFMGPVLALTQALAPTNMRATAGALLMFIISLVGAGLGPVAVGLLSDILNPTLGEDSLRAALWLAPVAAAFAALAYAMAAKTIIGDIQRAETTTAPAS